MSIPKTLIIGVNMHGEIHLQNNGELCKEVVPENMNLSVISAVAPGVPFVSTFENYENISAKVSNRINKIKNWNKLTNSYLEDLSENLRDLLVETNKEAAKEILKMHQQLYSKQNINQIYQQFSCYYDNAFRIKKYRANDTFTDKLFLKFSEGEVLNPDNIPEEYFNKIVIYNLEGKQDIFQYLASVGLNIEEITLSEMITFLVNIGVENLLVVDLSCSVFKGHPNYLTERNIRYLRRQMLKNN